MRYAILVASCLAGCAKPIPTTPLALTEAHRAAVEADIRGRLKDPESAKFGPMQAARSDNTGNVRVCGTVNARNSFGGYTGPVRFASDLSDAGGNIRVLKAAIGSPRPSGSVVIDGMCGVAKL